MGWVTIRRRRSWGLRHPIHHKPQEQDTKVNQKEECHKEKACFSRQQEQRFQCRQKKIKQEAYHSQVQWERAREVNRGLQIVQAAE
jgi:hypothetical protein